ncbi:hypothetical protein [Streptomyces sp. NPDC051546]|uniref:hypothetical protein n=1 Tax=Streptomyces sp. NPDC051546 TaxID=3365655 RepID=UPI0037B4B6D4
MLQRALLGLATLGLSLTGLVGVAGPAAADDYTVTTQQCVDGGGHIRVGATGRKYCSRGTYNNATIADPAAGVTREQCLAGGGTVVGDICFDGMYHGSKIITDGDLPPLP